MGVENTRANVLLADLFLLGDGVPKSCDQARLLLVAAAKKGRPETGRASMPKRLDTVSRQKGNRSRSGRPAVVMTLFEAFNDITHATPFRL